MNRTNTMETFDSVKDKQHDASGIANPYRYLWEKKDGVYYPIEPSGYVEDDETIGLRYERYFEGATWDESSKDFYKYINTKTNTNTMDKYKELVSDFVNSVDKDVMRDVIKQYVKDHYEYKEITDLMFMMGCDENFVMDNVCGYTMHTDVIMDIIKHNDAEDEVRDLLDDGYSVAEKVHGWNTDAQKELIKELIDNL